MHALHTVHAVPDLRLAAGRLRDGFLLKFHFLGTRFVRSLRAKSDWLPALARNCEISEAESVSRTLLNNSMKRAPELDATTITQRINASYLARINEAMNTLIASSFAEAMRT